MPTEKENTKKKMKNKKNQHKRVVTNQSDSEPNVTSEGPRTHSCTLHS